MRVLFHAFWAALLVPFFAAAAPLVSPPIPCPPRAISFGRGADALLKFASAPKAFTFTSTSTGYYPADDPLQGGFTDRLGKPLFTLQQFLRGEAPYVSISMDKLLVKTKQIYYGMKLRIPDLDDEYRKELDKIGKDHIEFRIVDSGGAFTGMGFSRMDICTANYRAAHADPINREHTVIAELR